MMRRERIEAAIAGLVLAGIVYGAAATSLYVAVRVLSAWAAT